MVKVLGTNIIRNENEEAKRISQWNKKKKQTLRGGNGTLKIVCVIKSKLTFRNRIVLSSEIYIFSFFIVAKCHEYMKNVTRCFRYV